MALKIIKKAAVPIEDAYKLPSALAESMIPDFTETEKDQTHTALEPDYSELDLYTLIETYGAMDKLLEPLRAKIAELSEGLAPLAKLRAELDARVQAAYEDQGPDEKQIAKSDGHRLEAGAKAKERKVTDMETVKNMMGTPLFMDVASVKLTDIDKYLTEDQKEQVLETTRTKRKWTVKPRYQKP